MRSRLLFLSQFLVGLLAIPSLAQELDQRPITSSSNTEASAQVFPRWLTQFKSARDAPIFAGRDETAWDDLIRERGWIMREADGWHLWYTGYNKTLSDTRYLGYATSDDGLNWTRKSDKPLVDDRWIEDMCVVKHDETYYMFAEGRNDIAHLLTSRDKVHWTSLGDLDIRTTSDQPIAPGPRGTPTVWIEGETWWLFYERSDQAVYAATSIDRKIWRNVSDEPVLTRGPSDYDKYAVAFDQVIKLGDRYYAYYHASSEPNWGSWTTCLATSIDLVHWEKYPNNPVLPVNPKVPGASSAMVVHDGKSWRMYTTHPEVFVYESQIVE